MKATDLIVKCLEKEGVEYVFGIMGKETLDFIDSLSKSEIIQFVNVRHEQGAAFMADVYGRLSKKVGVCTATLGPGATNLLTGIASANLDYSPVVAITGQAGFERQHKESHQYLEIVKIFEPATKWSVQIKDAQTIPEIIRRAFRLAKMEKPGPVLIELPENLASQVISNQPLEISPIPISVPIQQDMGRAVDIINQSKKPLIIVGNGVLRQEAIEELYLLIERLQTPCIHSFTAKGILPKSHPLNFFTFGFTENDLVLPVVEEADLLIVIGFDCVERLPKEWNGKKRPILHIDALPAEVDEYYPVQAELVGNVKEILIALENKNLPVKAWIPMGQIREQLISSYQLNNEDTMTFTIENVLKVMEKHSTDRTVIISDVGAHKVSIARTFQPKQAGRLIISNGLASMGIAIPGAIGAKLASPNDPVICITGDGGALMNFSELETAKRLGVSFIIILLNDSKLKLEEQMMMTKLGNDYGSDFTNPDFVKLAASFGALGFKANNLVEFDMALEDSLNRPAEISFIEVVLE
ncbi:acetolactate synthase large subunit [Pseudoneobacillus sp. C159]